MGVARRAWIHVPGKTLLGYLSDQIVPKDRVLRNAHGSDTGKYTAEDVGTHPLRQKTSNVVELLVLQAP